MVFWWVLSGTPYFLSSSNIDYIEYVFPWSIDFESQANEEGIVNICAVSLLDDTIDLTGRGSDISIASNVLQFEIRQPMPWVDPASNAADIFFDLTNDDPTANEIQLLIDTIINNPNVGGEEIISWIKQVSPGTITQKIDITAAHHISMGNFHQDGTTYSGLNRFLTKRDRISGSCLAEALYRLFVNFS